MPRPSSRAELLLAAALLAGCAAPPEPPPAAPEAVVRYEFLDRRTAVLGAVQPLGGGGSLRLRSRVADADGAVVHHLLVTDVYTATGWHYWDGARATPAGPLPVIITDRRVGRCGWISWAGCEHAEDLEIQLPAELLADQPVTVELVARDGWNQSVTVTPDQIAAQLAAVAGVRGARR